jgi:ribosome-associated protein
VKDLHQAKVPGIRVEGMKQGDWVLIDAADVIIHIFRPDIRSFYNLEKMWLTAGKASTGA